MSTTTTFELHDEFAATGSQPHGKGFIDRVTEQRMRHAEAYVSGFLARKSDADLKGLGFTSEHVAHIRATGVIPASFWR